MKIVRYFEDLEHFIKPNKALIIFGPRRSGKTTLLNTFLSKTNMKYRLDSGDNIKGLKGIAYTKAKDAVLKMKITDAIKPMKEIRDFL